MDRRKSVSWSRHQGVHKLIKKEKEPKHVTATSISTVNKVCTPCRDTVIRSTRLYSEREWWANLKNDAFGVFQVENVALITIKTMALFSISIKIMISNIVENIFIFFFSYHWWNVNVASWKMHTFHSSTHSTIHWGPSAFFNWSNNKVMAPGQPLRAHRPAVMIP